MNDHTSLHPLRRLHARHQQRGVALVVTLVLLVIITLVGVAGMQGVTLQERMSGNQYDRSLAFQAAEAALRAGEDAIRNDPNLQFLTHEDCRPGELCDVVPTGTGGVWQTVDGDFTVNTALTETTAQYYIQFLGVGSGESDLGQDRSAGAQQYGATDGTAIANFFRVTARNRAPNVDEDRSYVVLQSTIKVAN
ncbi:PilX N-terminal domain-containing pilus assembly protein [Thioalkalivibrio sp. ALE31]|uniref:pilus assembly PilX family protein n=1 Tax=Thioalkalivibrio sp. ALE31 TaxID=1158182 RepID=UPI000477E596|nr:PilX N-terminal domain-containing pilus assembly protein [Thioalkalivibrio sp. ALE31]